jgi:hypothetical protein
LPAVLVCCRAVLLSSTRLVHSPPTFSNLTSSSPRPLSCPTATVFLLLLPSPLPPAGDCCAVPCVCFDGRVSDQRSLHEESFSRRVIFMVSAFPCLPCDLSLFAPTRRAAITCCRRAVFLPCCPTTAGDCCAVPCVCFDGRVSDQCHFVNDPMVRCLHVVSIPALRCPSSTRLVHSPPTFTT